MEWGGLEFSQLLTIPKQVPIRLAALAQGRLHSTLSLAKGRLPTPSLSLCPPRLRSGLRLKQGRLHSIPSLALSPLAFTLGFG